MNIFQAIPAFLDLFRKGKEVANAEAWKAGTITANVVVGVLGAIVTAAKAVGYDLPLEAQTLDVVGTAIVSVVAAVNAVMHVITSARVGLSPSVPSNPPKA